MTCSKYDPGDLGEDPGRAEEAIAIATGYSKPLRITVEELDDVPG